LETSSKHYHEITDFLIAIAEPISRPKYIHEYILTRFSLYAAVSVKLETNYIIKTLKKFSKLSKLPREVKDYIRECTKSYGKAKLVLKNNRYFIETEYEGILDDLLQLKTVKAAADAVG